MSNFSEETSSPTSTRPATSPGTARCAAAVAVSPPTVWLTAEQATAYLGLPSCRALYQAVRRGQVPAHRLGRRRLRFHRSELDKVLGKS